MTLTRARGKFYETSQPVTRRACGWADDEEATTFGSRCSHRSMQAESNFDKVLRGQNKVRPLRWWLVFHPYTRHRAEACRTSLRTYLRTSDGAKSYFQIRFPRGTLLTRRSEVLETSRVDVAPKCRHRYSSTTVATTVAWL